MAKTKKATTACLTPQSQSTVESSLSIASRKETKKKNRRKKGSSTQTGNNVNVMALKEENDITDDLNTVTVGIQTEPPVYCRFETMFAPSLYHDPVAIVPKKSTDTHLNQAMLDLYSLIPQSNQELRKAMTSIEQNLSVTTQLNHTASEAMPVAVNNSNYGMKSIELVALGLKLFESLHGNRLPEVER